MVPPVEFRAGEDRDGDYADGVGFFGECAGFDDELGDN